MHQCALQTHGKVQNMDPLRGPGPWTGSIKIWTGSMDPLFLLGLKIVVIKDYELAFYARDVS